MNCSTHIAENDQKVACKKVYKKRYYAENKERTLTRQKRWRTENVEILKTRRKRWYEINKERLDNSKRAYCQQNNEHIRNYRRQYRKNNRERLNKYWKSYYATNKEQINQILRDQRQRKIGARDQESEKLETSPRVKIWSETQHGELLKDFVEETVFKVSVVDFSIIDTLFHFLSYLLLIATIQHEVVHFSS